MISRLLENLLIAVVGAVAGAITSTIIARMIPARIDGSYWWAWAIAGFLVTLLIVWGYRRCGLRLLTYGSRVAIRTSDYNYITADLNQDNQLFGRSPKVTAWQIFEILDASQPFSRTQNRLVHYGDHIALKAINNDRYVGADLNSEKQLTTWATWVRGWETFTLCLPEQASIERDKTVRFGNSFALQAHNKSYVSYIQNGDGRLLATASQIRSWETFVFVNLSCPK